MGEPTRCMYSGAGRRYAHPVASESLFSSAEPTPSERTLVTALVCEKLTGLNHIRRNEYNAVLGATCGLGSRGQWHVPCGDILRLSATNISMTWYWYDGPFSREMGRYWASFVRRRRPSGQRWSTTH